MIKEGDEFFYIPKDEIDGEDESLASKAIYCGLIVLDGQLRIILQPPTRGPQAIIEVFDCVSIAEDYPGQIAIEVEPGWVLINNDPDNEIISVGRFGELNKTKQIPYSELPQWEFEQ